MPALPLEEAGKYVAGAYVVFFALVVVYVAIIGAKIARIERQVGELLDLVKEEGREPGRSGLPDAAPRGSARGAKSPAEAVPE